MKNHLTGVFWGPRDNKTFCGLLSQCLSQLPPVGIYAGDNLVTFGRNLGFLDDERFSAAVADHAETAVEQAIIWRTHVVCWAAASALRRQGDLVECGCYKGVTARIICDCLDFGVLDRRFVLYDLFEHSEEMQHHGMQEHGVGLFEQVRARFSGFPNVEVVKGEVPGCLDGTAPERIAFLHIDMNNAAAEVGALEALFDRVADGGIIVFDDYGWLAYREQKAAEDAWLAKRGYRILELPTGQGLLVK